VFELRDEYQILSANDRNKSQLIEQLFKSVLLHSDNMQEIGKKFSCLAEKFDGFKVNLFLFNF
jgi:hypothetical protein